jgi:hypothetical protein
MRFSAISAFSLLSVALFAECSPIVRKANVHSQALGLNERDVISPHVATLLALEKKEATSLQIGGSFPGDAAPELTHNLR